MNEAKRKYNGCFKSGVTTPPQQYQTKGEAIGIAGEVAEIVRLHDINKDLLEALTAIRARISGEWDNPALLKFGPLSDMTTDIQIIAQAAIRKAKAEGKPSQRKGRPYPYNEDDILRGNL